MQIHEEVRCYMDTFIFICQFVGFVVVGFIGLCIFIYMLKEFYLIIYDLILSFRVDTKKIHLGDSATKILLISFYNEGYRYVSMKYHEDGKNSLQVAFSKELGYCEDVYIDDYIAMQLYSCGIADTITYSIEDLIGRL